MKEISGEELRNILMDDPEWPLRLTEPVVVTTYFQIKECPFSELSPLLTFQGKNTEGECAEFAHCFGLKSAQATFCGSVRFIHCGLTNTKGLKVTSANLSGVAVGFDRCDELESIEGTFPGRVDALRNSKLKDISKLVVTGSCLSGNAARFNLAIQLEKASGTYAGFVDFTDSGIKEIKDLNILKPNTDGNAASFKKCYNLRVATGTYPGHVNFSESNVQRIENLTVNSGESPIDPVSRYPKAASFRECRHLKVAAGNYPNGTVDFTRSTIQSIGQIEAAALDICDCDGLAYCPAEILKVCCIDPTTLHRIVQSAEARKVLKEQNQKTIEL